MIQIVRRMALIAALFGVSAPAFAATTYLKCNYTDSQGEVVSADLALNEANREADIWFHNTNAGSQWRADYSQKMVTIRLDLQNFIFVDRTSLKFTRVFLQAGADKIYERGSCKKTVAPKRAF